MKVSLRSHLYLKFVPSQQEWNNTVHTWHFKYSSTSEHWYSHVYIILKRSGHEGKGKWRRVYTQGYCSEVTPTLLSLFCYSYFSVLIYCHTVVTLIVSKLLRPLYQSIRNIFPWPNESHPVSSVYQLRLWWPDLACCTLAFLMTLFNVSFPYDFTLSHWAG